MGLFYLLEKPLFQKKSPLSRRETKRFEQVVSLESVSILPKQPCLGYLVAKPWTLAKLVQEIVSKENIFFIGETFEISFYRSLFIVFRIKEDIMCGLGKLARHP